MQYSFEFYEDQDHRPERPERFFFCLRPDRDTCDRVTRFCDRFFAEKRLGGNRLSAERLHVSLHHLGDHKRLKSTLRFAADQAAAAICIAPVEVEFGSILSFNDAPKQRNRPLVLLAKKDGLHELFLRLGAAMFHIGLKPSGRFTPHMTLLYGPRSLPQTEIEPIRFVARDFVLIHSKLGLGQHEVIGRSPLRG